jgi:chitinase
VDSDDASGGLFRPGKKPSERLDTHYANLSALVAAGAYERRWDRAAQAPYLWSREKRIFVTLDDPESLRVKSRYIVEHGLAGAMFWEYYADPTGTLLDTLFTQLRGRRR